MRLSLILLAGCLAPVAAFAQTADHAPSTLSSSAKLEHGKGENWNYRKAGLNLGAYRSILVEPTVVYSGPDAQFKDIPAADRAKFANILTQSLRTELAQSPGLASKAGPGVLRIQLTLLGADKTMGGVSTVTHVMPVGLAMNAVKSLAGKKGSMTGSALIAVELKDSKTGELLAAAVRRESPDALNIDATLSTAETVKAIGKDVGQAIAKRLNAAMHRK
ncbi:MAG TPA: DUF3313 domain-containing protein [Sphingobium sp.]|uniref:DUF3313 domain-containing protein n=1 Tax=Sphingobium sp. TaxID=1912891 RepID=UPI002ED57559